MGSSQKRRRLDFYGIYKEDLSLGIHPRETLRCPLPTWMELDGRYKIFKIKQITQNPPLHGAIPNGGG